MSAETSNEKLFQRKVFNYSLGSQHKEAFKKLSSEKALALMIELNEWLMERQVDPDEDREHVPFNLFYSEYKPPRRKK